MTGSTFANNSVSPLRTIVANKPADIAALNALNFDGTDVTVEAELKNMIFTIGENMSIRRFDIIDGTTGCYIHGGGSAGVVTKFDTDVDTANAAFVEYAKNVCMQIAAMSPSYVDRDAVPATVIENEKAILDTVALLTSKPVIYACNMSESDFVSGIDTNENYQAVCEIAKAEGSEVLPICAGLEAEISSLSDEDQDMFLADLGVETSGLDLLIQRSYNLLGLISYLTAGQPEVRAWTIKKGTKAPQAAGKIHSDFERGFIRAEVVSFDTLMELGSLAAAKEKGLVKSEGYAGAGRKAGRQEPRCCYQCAPSAGASRGCAGARIGQNTICRTCPHAARP